MIFIKNRQRKLFLLILTLFFCQVIFIGSYLSANEEPGKYSDKIKQFEEYVTDQMAFDRTVGLSIGFFKDDFTWVKGFGYADLENKSPVNAESSFRMASITKTFTAIAVLQLVEKGKIDLDAEVQTYVPYFPEKKWPVISRYLLGHLGGISHYRDYDKEGHIKIHKNTREALEIFSDFDLVAEPGTRYNYSTYGFNILGAVVESASGQSYGEYIKENIFKPLGMENSRLDDPVDLIPNRVRGYRIIENQIRNSEYVDISSRFAGGGTRSSAADLLKYARGVISGKLLKEETTRMMLTPMIARTADGGRLTGYGMGWSVRPWNGHFQVAHGGAQAETRTYILILPGLNFAIAACTNTESTNPITYLIRLAELILEEDLDSSVHIQSKEMRTMLSALQQVYSYGLSFYERDNIPLTEDEQELKEAFTFFNRYVDYDALKKNFKETGKKIGSGIHPESKEAFTKIGSFMAAALKEAYGEDALKNYPKKGVFAFFNDFINVARKWPLKKKPFTFNDNFNKIFSRWYRDWEKTYTDYVRNLVITHKTDFKEVGDRLKKTFANARLYPDFSRQMMDTAEGFLPDDKLDKVFEILTVCDTLYPNSPGVLSNLAFAHLWKGNVNMARILFKKVFKIDPEHRAIGSRMFGYFDYLLEEGKKTNARFDLAAIALELHPQNPEVHLGVGNLYLEAGKRKEAEEYYRKAVGFGLDFSEVKVILEKLEQSKEK
jgi:CubicO group peptidase (beta-lactamase class C family)